MYSPFDRLSSIRLGIQMRKIALIYGFIIGTIVIGFMLVGFALSGEKASYFSPVIGFLIMFGAHALIYFGIKRHRDQNLGGNISFRGALIVGIAISAVTGLTYVTIWEINLYITDYGFMEEYTSALVAAKEAAGVSGSELDSLQKR